MRHERFAVQGIELAQAGFGIRKLTAAIAPIPDNCCSDTIAGFQMQAPVQHVHLERGHWIWSEPFVLTGSEMRQHL